MVRNSRRMVRSLLIPSGVFGCLLSGQAPGCASMCVSVAVASDNCPLDSGCPNPDPCPHKAGSGQSHVCPGFLARHISSFHPSRIGRISPQPAGHCFRVSMTHRGAFALCAVVRVMTPGFPRICELLALSRDCPASSHPYSGCPGIVQCPCG